MTPQSKGIRDLVKSRWPRYRPFSRNHSKAKTNLFDSDASFTYDPKVPVLTKKIRNNVPVLINFEKVPSVSIQKIAAVQFYHGTTHLRKCTAFIHPLSSVFPSNTQYSHFYESIKFKTYDFSLYI